MGCLQSCILFWEGNVENMSIDKTFYAGVALVILGGIIDRAIYHWWYLPGIGKTFAFVVSLDNIIMYYKMPISWLGLGPILVGLICVFATLRNN